MLKLHPVFLERDGLSQFVVLPCEEFKAIVDAIEGRAGRLALAQRFVCNEFKF